MSEHELRLAEVVVNDILARVEQFRTFEQVWLSSRQWICLRLQLNNLAKSDLPGKITRAVAEKISDLPELLNKAPIADQSLRRDEVVCETRALITNLANRPLDDVAQQDVLAIPVELS